jgi:hypothetical protein
MFLEARKDAAALYEPLWADPKHRDAIQKDFAEFRRHGMTVSVTLQNSPTTPSAASALTPVR